MKKEANKEVLKQIEEYRKTGKDYINPDSNEDMDMDFSKCGPEPKKNNNTNKSNKN